MQKLIHKKLLVIIISILTVTISIAQTNMPRSIQINDSLYFDQTEVDVASWLSFYSWVLINKGKQAARGILPDSTAVEPALWAYIISQTTNYVSLTGIYTGMPIGYFNAQCQGCEMFGTRLPKNPKLCAMLSLPVTGISYQQAVMFCQWRTKISQPGNYIYRLPTTAEWELLASKNLTTNSDGKPVIDSIDKKHRSVFNYNNITSGENNYCAKGIAGITMFPPHKSGAYEVFGNVSEMTAEKGIAKGGNFTIYASQCNVKSEQTYSTPQPWLGIRCVAVKTVGTGMVHKTWLDNFNDVINDNYDTSTTIFIDNRDGKTYPTVLIGDQTWLAKNLAYKPDSGKYWAWNNEERYVTQYGYLYTWETANNVCPTGWHLPGKDEFEILLNFLGKGDLETATQKLLVSGNSGFAIGEFWYKTK